MTHPAELPPNELERIARLRALAILDTQPEAVFDAIAQATSAACGAPIALLSLVDTDRLWFKANVGMPGVMETSRDIAFCAHAILGEDVMEVSDAQQDWRFAGNPLVTGEPGIRFYAGAPICLIDGTRLGTLCAIDRVPRKLSAQQLTTLRQLAVTVAQILEFRARTINAVAVTTQAQLRLDNLYAALPTMLQLLDAEYRLLAVSDIWLAKLGYSREEVIGRHAWDFLAPQSREHIQQRVLPGTLCQTDHDDLPCQLVCKNGRVIDAVLSIRIEKDSTQSPPRSMVISQDVTERTQSEVALEENRLLLQAIVESVPAMIAYWDHDKRCVFANRAYANWVAVNPERIRGMHARDILGAELYEQSEPYMLGALRGAMQVFERIHHDAQGNPLHAAVTYVPDTVGDKVKGCFILLTDTTELTRQVEERTLELTCARDEARSANRAKDEFLANVSHEMRTPLHAIRAFTALGLAQSPEFGGRKTDSILAPYRRERTAFGSIRGSAADSFKIPGGADGP